MSLYKNSFRVESTRLKGWDYASDGWYFVTICTRNEECFFGCVVADEVRLSAIGEIARQFWAEIPDHFVHVRLDEYVIMPNHVHGIVIIDNGNTVETRHVASLQPSSADKFNKFGPLKPGSLQAIIHAYKSAVTRWCHKNGHNHFAWQARFYDHIIRDEGSLSQIRQYIVDNPARWEADQDNAANLWM